MVVRKKKNEAYTEAFLPLLWEQQPPSRMGLRQIVQIHVSCLRNSENERCSVFTGGTKT